MDGKSDPADTDVLYAALYLLSADRIINVIRAKRDLAYCLPLSYDLQGLNAFAKTLARKDILSSEDGSNKLMAALEAELPEDMEAALEIAEKYQKYGDRGGVKAGRSPFFHLRMSTLRSRRKIGNWKNLLREITCWVRILFLKIRNCREREKRRTDRKNFMQTGQSGISLRENICMAEKM